MVARCALRKRLDFVLPLPGQAVLAIESDRFLSAPRALAAGEGAAGGRVDLRPFDALCGAAAALSLFADGVAVVCRNALACDWAGAVRRTGHGRSFHLCAITRR